VPEQRLLHVQARERRLDLDAEHVLPDLRPQALDEREDVLLGAERHLHVELSDLDDAVGAQVFVAKAARDLVIATYARNHQQLLQLLRRLWERKELPRMEAGWDDEVARALGRALQQHGGLDLDELVTV